MDDSSEDRIEQQMQETLSSLTEKVETLEQKIVGTVEHATTAVTDTVDTIKEAVQDTVASVEDGVKDGVASVKDMLDIPAQVERRPWVIVGGALALGYCLGSFLPRRGSSQKASPSVYQPPPVPFTPVASVPTSQGTVPSEPAQPSLWASEMTKLKGLALGVLFGTAREWLASSVAPAVGEQVREIVDSVTKKIGGEPLPHTAAAAEDNESPGFQEQASAEHSMASPQRYMDAGRRVPVA